MQNDKELRLILDRAQKLHGHLGPFLVLGVRMGMIAKRELKATGEEQASLKANVKLPLFPPFSCLLDGIQVSTSCTIGNQRLTIENSEEICVAVRKQNAIGTVSIRLSREIAEELEKRHLEDALTEEFALELAGKIENQLFRVEVE